MIAGATIGLFLIVDGTYFASNITKIPDGGWFPLLVAAISFTVLTTWAKGRQLMRARLRGSGPSAAVFIKSAASSVHRVRGTSVFLSTSADIVPAALLHNLKHNQVLHERVLILNVKVEEVPQIAPSKRIEIHDAGDGFFRVILHYGFMEEVDIPRDLAGIKACGEPFNMMRTSFFLGRQKLIASRRAPAWRCGANGCSPGCSRTPKARWNSSSFRPTAWSSSAASSRSKRKRALIFRWRWRS